MRFWCLARIAAASLSVAICFAWSGEVTAAPPLGTSKPLAPRDSLKQIVIEPGLAVELVAHEPNVIDPIAIRFDEDGRMWVVQMRDYPTGPTKDFPARSRISILRDKDGDGFFETATVFADDLSFATGLQPWKGGVFVTMAGQVAYMKDTNGDDKADVVEKWYAGFSQGNQQLRANHPKLALDNHIYVAAGLRGGTIVDAQRPDVPPVSISGMDFRFDPITRKFEAVTGEAQFGLSFDDYGNRFCCANRDPAIHMVLEDWNLKKNPLVAIDRVLHHVVYGASRTPIYPIGRIWNTSNLHEGQFTAACGVEIYRGDALPGEYYNNIFVCEPTGYLIHRARMKPHGVTFTDLPNSKQAEFFASRDEWCRPVNLEVGPDGALYVVDMYRAIIEHPEWMPEELRKLPNMRAGNDRGRIFRIVPKDFRRPKPPKFSQLSSKALVDEFSNGNAWRRETAQRLLLERQDKSAQAQLEQVATRIDSALARVHALRLLQALDLTSEKLLLRLIDDSNPRIVEQAILAAETRLKDSKKLRDRVAQLAEHTDARVRFQALLTAMPFPSVPKYPADRWEQDAMLIAARDRSGEVLAGMLQHPAELKANISDPKKFIIRFAQQSAASKNSSEYLPALEALMSNPEYERVGLTGFLTEMTRSGVSLVYVRFKLAEEANRGLDQAFDRARLDAENGTQSESNRCEAIDLLAFGPSAADILTRLALNDASQDVRLRAITALGMTRDFKSWNQVLGRFSAETPVVQRAILDGVFMSVERTLVLLDEIEAGRIKPTVVDVAHSALILNHKDAAIRMRAQKLLASAIPADREKVLAEYRPVLSMKADAMRGRGIFEKRCSTCHKIGDVGVQFAPDISDSREKKPEQLLTDIIQPNRAVDSNYFSYTATTIDGRVHTGVLTAETSTSVTLKQQDGKSETLRRDEIEDLHNNGVSFMPEGLEKDIPMQDMADLISFIKNWRYLDSSPQSAPAKPQAGN